MCVGDLFAFFTESVDAVPPPVGFPFLVFVPVHSDDASRLGEHILLLLCESLDGVGLVVSDADVVVVLVSEDVVSPVAACLGACLGVGADVGSVVEKVLCGDCFDDGSDAHTTILSVTRDNHNLSGEEI